jgi:predicted GH43/DUF377 family glycosyl hydrolase
MKTYRGTFFTMLLLFSFGLDTLHAQHFLKAKPTEQLRAIPIASSVVAIPAADPLPAGTYTIGTGGDFATIDSVFDRLSGGGILGPVTFLLTDTLYVASPARENMFKLTGPIAGAGSSSRITIRPADNVTTVIQGSGWTTLYLVNASYITIDGIAGGPTGFGRLTVRALYNTQVPWNDAIDIQGNSDFIYLQNMTVRSDDARLSSGIWFFSSPAGGPDSCLISRVFVPSASTGVFVTAYDYFTGEGSLTSFRPKGFVIRNSRIGSLEDNKMSWGIDATWTEDILIERNTISNLKASTGWGLDNGLTTIGILATSSLNGVIRDNVVCALRGSGETRVWGILATRAFSSGTGLKIFNNMIYDLKNTGTTSPASTIGIHVMRDNPNVPVAHNSVFLNDTSAVPDGISALRLGASVVSGVTIKNNIFINTSKQNTTTVAGMSDAIRLNGGLAAIVGSDYNDLFVGSYSSSRLVTALETTYSALNNWQATGNDAHSVSMLPVFGASTLHLDNLHTTTEYLCDRGIPIPGITVDIDGDVRNASTPDLGADEVAAITATGGIAWFKDPQNPVVSGGGGTGYVHAFNPCVIKNADSARFEMWYNRAASNSSEPPWLVGYATSPDGTHWTQRLAPVMSPTASTWDAYTIAVPVVIRENGTYKMWYSSYLNSTSPGYIGYATSPDGINWTKYAGNPIFGPGTAAWEQGGPDACSVMPVQGGYKIWYDAYDTSWLQSQIGYATSVDGIVWVRDTVRNPILPLGSTGLWDGATIGVPRVLRIPIVNSSDVYFMWFAGTRSDGRSKSGLAMSPDGITNWTKSPRNPVLSPTVGAWDGTDATITSVMLYRDSLHAWYDGGTRPASSNLWQIGHAVSREPSTDVREQETQLDVPTGFALAQNYPNPFNPSTTISYALPHRSHVTLSVFNTLGQQVTTLVNGEMEAGNHNVTFDATGLASGVYLYRLQAGEYVETRKLILLR